MFSVFTTLSKRLFFLNSNSKYVKLCRRLFIKGNNKIVNLQTRNDSFRKSIQIMDIIMQPRVMLGTHAHCFIIDNATINTGEIWRTFKR